MSDKKTVFAMQLKLPVELRNWLKEQGKKNFHSMHSEVLTIIRDAKNKEGDKAAV